VPASYTISMTASGPNPDPLCVHPGDKIMWTNNVGTAVNLTYPTCVSPDGGKTVTIASGSSGKQQTVNNGAHGSFNYSYADSRGIPQNGTIDVS
jgi:plastocyanin